ncbi:MAG: PKD domain-containing protein [Bacteroidales bacterium]|nr:PKD domain-containing protein [Bacteroidales bacterium]
MKTKTTPTKNLPGLTSYLLPIVTVLLFTMAECDKNDGNGDEPEKGDPPVAGCQVSTNKTLVGYAVSFTDNSTGDPTSWYWSFGDGSSSTEQNTTHKYAAAGNYQVYLAAGNEWGTDTFAWVSKIKVYDTIMTDAQSNAYKIILINKQIWMAENLKTYTPTSLIYGNDTTNEAIYGRLYQWEEACTVCPTGWHLSTDEEWQALESYLGMSQEDLTKFGERGTNEGGKLKEIGTALWHEPNTGATNEVGFSALPGGDAYDPNTFGEIGHTANFWCNSADYFGGRAYRYIYHDEQILRRKHTTILNYYSVRCLKD